MKSKYLKLNFRGKPGEKMIKCWSYTEQFNRDKIENLQLVRLKALLEYLDKKSPYYRKKLSEYGCLPHQFKDLNDLRRLPLVGKQDIIDDIDEKEYFFYKNLFVDNPENIIRWHKTSGTTGIPIRFPDTFWDWNAYAELSAEALYSMGIRQSDIVIVPFGYGPFIAFWIYISALEKIGAAFIPAGGVDTIGRISLIKDFNATVLLTTPSYSIRLGKMAHENGNIPGKDLKIRLVIVTGEPINRSMKEEIMRIWQAEPKDRLGSVETGGIAFECPQCQGLYHIQEGYLIPEIIDMQTGEQVDPGGIGELVVTPLYRRGMPLLRFKTGNIVKLAKENRFKCGRNFLSLEETKTGVVIRRQDLLTKVRGVLINPEVVGNIVNQFDELGENYQVVIENIDGLDEVTVKVETRLTKFKEANAEISKKLAEDLNKALMIRVNVEILRLGGLIIEGDKLNNIIDLRKGA